MLATRAQALELSMVGERPSGITPVDQPLVQIASAVMKKNGLTPIYVTTSTDANIPISLGLPAITIAAGGNGSAYHSLNLRAFCSGADRVHACAPGAG